MTDKNYNDLPLTFQNNDIQISKFEEYVDTKDILQIKNYAKALSEFIQECETPMTIGVQGDWGIGKTSMLNTVKAYLERENRSNSSNSCGLVWVNTWHYSMFGQEEYLGLSVIKGILEQLADQFDLKKEDGTAKKALDFAKNLIKNAQVSVAGVSVSAKDADNNNEPSFDDVSMIMKGFKTSLEELTHEIVVEGKANKNVDRLVFFIDDLDRVKPVKALELLEVLKNFFDLPNCVFLLAVDFEVIQMGMQQKLGIDLQKKSGKSFFDKIIQLPFLMPSSSYNLANYIKKLLKSANIDVSDGDENFYEEVTSITVGRNPRSVKRVVNYARLIRKIRDMNATRNEKDSRLQRQILYSLICMQIAWPEIFTFFAKNPNETTIRQIEDWNEQEKIPFINKLYDRTPNKELLKSHISAFFDLLFELLDEDSDGSLSNKELKPVWDTLYVAKLTNQRDFKEPFDIFQSYVLENASSKRADDVQNQLDKLKLSKWISGRGIEFQLSGRRYVTLVYNRKQIGSLVTLKTRPLIFRLNADDQLLRDTYLESNTLELDEHLLTELIKPVENASLTGFGDTVVDLDSLYKIDEKKQSTFLNDLCSYVTNVNNG